MIAHLGERSAMGFDTKGAKTMENESTGTLSTTELVRTIDRHTSACQAQLAAVKAAEAAATQNSVASYYESAPDFESRRARFHNLRDHAEAVAGNLLVGVQRDAQRLQEQVDGPIGIGLTPAEWSAAAALTSMATTRIQNAPLSVAIADLRGSLAAADRPRVAAVLVAAEARLAAAEPAPADGRVRVRGNEHRSELQALVGEAKSLLRDKSLDPARERLRELAAVRGELGSRIWKQRHARELAEKIASGERVPFPPREIGTDGKTRHQSPDGIFR